MKKIILSITILLSFLIIGSVSASGTAKITITPSSKTYLVGNTFKVTVNISSTEAMAGLSYTIQYNSSILELRSTTASTGGARNLDAFMNNSTTSVSYTYTFYAKASGKSTISVTGVEVQNKETSQMSINASTSTIRIMTQKELEATYSSNNNLATLVVEGYSLEPEFNKNTLEYTVTLPPETEQIKVSATKADSYATINGIGNINVSEGANTIKIDVVAQNGNVKTYTINATVKEYDPIEVNVDGVNYTVLRSKKNQTLTNNLFTETTIQLGEYEVPAYYNETTNITLVALKDETGTITYFIYDNNVYKKFNELKLGNVDLVVYDGNNIPKNYYKDEVIINEIIYPAYKIKDTSRYSLIYGTNLINNNTSYYVYDNYENTLQRYDSELMDEYNNKEIELNKIIYILMGTSIGLFILLIISIIISIIRSKKKEDKVISKIKTTKEEKLPPSEKVAKDIQSQIDDIEKTLIISKNSLKKSKRKK